ncbi:glyoxalase [Mycobacteroides saopaulense]|uniref:Glyoxalase n=1 Tax=Mycobacteroides saopaulense TaxID=1578165 RepID=A0A1S4VRY8_9MYCO|nr:VOC family protein [Mycobacteroides saopaulense]ALR13575.1 glyoxalase [Mycobacteroides saopaulense]ORB49115.1 glyoxalase [Mycobacteroides saopaulense]
MITELDSVLLDIPNLADAKDAYSRLFGTSTPHPQLQLGLPEWAPYPGMLFRVENQASAAKIVDRRGLTLTAHADLAAGQADGLTLGLTERTAAPSQSGGDSGHIDHLVLFSPNRDRIIATLCGRLGFDLRLDRVQSWGVHQLFFRCAGLVVEVVLRDEDPAGPDSLWGIAWRTENIDATHARLQQAGVALSDIRNGHKPGTRVATVKDPALAVPTILIEQR